MYVFTMVIMQAELVCKPTAGSLYVHELCMCVQICKHNMLHNALYLDSKSYDNALRIPRQPIISPAMPKYEAVLIPRSWSLGYTLPSKDRWYSLSRSKCQIIDANNNNHMFQLRFRSNCRNPMGFANYRNSTSPAELARGFRRFTHDVRFPQRPDILVREPQVLKTTVHVEFFTAAEPNYVKFELKDVAGDLVFMYDYIAVPGGRAITVAEVRQRAIDELTSNAEITTHATIVVCQPVTWRTLSPQKVLWKPKALIRRDQPNLHAVLARNALARHA